MTPTPQSGASPPEADRLLFDLAPEPLWLVSLNDLRIREVNEAALQRLGYTREQFRGLRLADLYGEADLDRFRRGVAARDPQSSSFRAFKTRTAHGESIDTDLAVRFFDIGIDSFVLICALDVSARNLLEERLRQAGKMEAIGMLAGGIAHDFNNLLTIISGYSQLLLNSVAEPDRFSIEQILKASERAAALTGQLLAFSRRQELQPQLLDVNRIVAGMTTMLRRLIGEHIELRLSLAPGLGAVYADPGQLDQVIMNLVVNARDAMAQGGTLVIETANVDLNDDYSGFHLGVRPGHFVMLAVNDTGVGMTASTRARVFDPFFTTKEKGRGTGLGLSTVYGIVKQASGAVELFSEVQRGTSVKVFLPRAGNVVEDAKPSFNASEAPGGRECILVVEDEDAVRRLVRATLERRGYRVMVASGGPEALEIIRNTETVDLLITDLVMPQMSGVEVAQRIRADRPSVCVLFVSGYTDRSLQRTEALPDDSEFLQKPFTPAALSGRVRQMLDKGKRGSSAHSTP